MTLLHPVLAHIVWHSKSVYAQMHTRLVPRQLEPDPRWTLNSLTVSWNGLRRGEG